MSESDRYQFGRIGLPQSELPTPKEVCDEVTEMDDKFQSLRKEEDDKLSGKVLEYREKGRSAYHGDSHGEYSFCYFYYVTDTENSIVIRNEEGEEEERNQPQLVRPRIFYFENGQFAFESKQDLEKHWVPRFIGKATGTSVAENYSFYNISQDIMKDFYDTCDHISVFRFGSPEDGGVFEDDSDLDQALNELTENIDSQKFSGGNSGKNLKEVEIMDEAAEKMQLLELHGSRDDGYTDEIFASGTAVVTWSEKDWAADAGTEKRAETICRKLVPFLQKLD